MIVANRFVGTLLALSACIACLCSGMAWGQATNSADVTGTVTDPSGGVVPGVTVTLNDLDKNIQRSLVTNGSGVYDTGPLVPEDRYMISFKKAGFATLERGPMTLSIGVTGLNAQLTLGQSAQEITVNTAAPMLQTTTAEISSTIPLETLRDLPQTAGIPDWQSIITFLPGTRGNGTDNSGAAMGATSVNGAMPFTNSLLNGASTNSPMSNNVINTPVFDAIAEVKMSDSAYSAQYGQGGIVYNQISKGGTNTFHGMAYDYFKNTDLNAAPFGFNGVAGFKSPIRFNDFGGNVGGPVVKNKIFFFFGVEQTVSHGQSAVTFQTVPTVAMRAGNFAGMNTIYDPNSQTVNASTGVVTRQPFPNNQIPASELDPVAQNIQSYYPLPNLAGQVVNGIDTNNFDYQLPTRAPKIKYFGRFDADITSNNRITGSAAWNDGPSIAFSPVAPLNQAPGDVMNTNNQLSDYWTINAHTINEFRIGMMGEYDEFAPETVDKNYPAELGLQISKANVFPTVSITNYYGLGSGLDTEYHENTIDISDQMTLIRGRHTLHFGGEVIIFRADSSAWGDYYGANVGFTGVYTAGSNVGTLASTTGASYADFLLGYVQNWSALVSPEYGGRLKNPGIFFQDDFKVNPKLTLNIGLRWEGNTGWSDVQGNIRSFDTTITNPATNAPGAMWYASTHTNGRTSLQQAVWNNWMPRFGFAYVLGTKTTFRGGFGMYTFPWNVDTYASCCLGAATAYSGNETDSTGNVSPVVILSSSGNTNYQGSKGSAINSLYGLLPTTPQAYNGQAVGFQPYKQPSALLKSWNFTIERQLAGNLTANVSYVGSRESHLPFLTDLNQVPQSLLGPNDASSRPYPFQTISGYTTQALSNYDAFQAEITRRFSNGLMFDFNYTWSHMLSDQDSSGWGSEEGAQVFQNAYVPMANYGPSNFDIRQMFKGQVAYNLPFGTGRTYLHNNKGLDAAFGGWNLFGDVIVQGGSPFTPRMSVNNSYSQSNNNLWYPNVVGSPGLSNPSINEWFNVNAFAAPTPGTFGDMGRNSVYGPPLSAVNMSLKKTFSFTERFKLDFSVNATNLPNHPSFALPDPVIGPGHIGKITAVSVASRAVELVAKFRF
jgi:hypothetical protein